MVGNERVLSQKMAPKYYIGWINNFDLGCIVNYPNYSFGGGSAIVGETEYIMRTINNQLFAIDYTVPFRDPLVVKTTASRFKMLIELK